MRRPYRREQSGPDPVIIITIVIGLLLVLPCTLVVLLARYLPRRLTEQRAFWPLVAIVGIGCISGFLLVAYPFKGVYNQIVQILGEVVREARTDSWSVQALWIGLRPIWFESLLFAPGVAFLRHLFTPQSAGQHLLAQQRQQSNALQKASNRVRRRMTRKQLPGEVRGQMVLGLPVQGDLQEWHVKGMVVLLEDELAKHGIVLGASGSGKSETLLRIAVGAASVYSWQVIYIDGKGDEDAGMRFIAAMKSAGLQRVKMFPCEPYNGWMGDEEALLSRLLAVEEYSDTHYRAVAENLLRLAIAVPESPVKSSDELLRRLNLPNEVLLGLYAGNADQEAYLTYLSKRDPLGVYNRYAALFGKLRGKLDGACSYDSVDAAYICLDGLALSGIVSGLGRYFVEDFAHYAGRRKPKVRRVLFIFDELGAIDVDLSNLFERVRSRGVSVYVSGQSEHSIAYKGRTQNAERLLSAATSIILHAYNNPERVIARAGTQHIVEETAGMANEEVTGSGTLRVKEIPKIDPNAVRRLPTGEVYVMAHGKAERIRVLPVRVEAAALAEAEAYVQQSTHEAPVQILPSLSSSASSVPLPVSAEPAIQTGRVLPPDADVSSGQITGECEEDTLM